MASVRYPGPDLVPFAVEALGRPGKGAVAFLRSLAPADPELRSAALGSSWQALSATLQVENAELLLSAAGAESASSLAEGHEHSGTSPHATGNSLSTRNRSTQTTTTSTAAICG